MYAFLLFLHSILRWFVLASLVYAVYRAAKGWFGNKAFSKFDDTIRHTTATISHVQLTVGITLYSISPIVKYFWGNYTQSISDMDISFFGLIHMLCMVSAILVITIGSALAKRKTADAEKFKTMFIWFFIALFIIFIAIPWPFSPLAARPYLRPL
jgi:hypothetical protein